MGIAQTILRFLRRPKGFESIKSDYKSISDRTEAIQEPISQSSKEIYEQTPSIELQKDSLELGIAAGYTGKTLRSIESSLIRIESQMTTRDWFNLQFGQTLRELVDVLQQHENKEQLRFESIHGSLNSLRSIASLSPQPIKDQLFKQIQVIESQLPLTPRMRQIIEITKQQKEVSYEDLAKTFNLDGTSSLRGLLSNMMKRTNNIERFEKDGRGWVRFIGSKDLDRSKSEDKTEEALLIYNFESIAEKEKFNIIKRSIQTFPTFVIEKEGKNIGIGLELTSDIVLLQARIKELTDARFSFNLQEIWLVFPSTNQPFSEELTKLIKNYGIRLFILGKEGLKEIL